MIIDLACQELKTNSVVYPRFFVQSDGSLFSSSECQPSFSYMWHENPTDWRQVYLAGNVEFCNGYWLDYKLPDEWKEVDFETVQKLIRNLAPESTKPVYPRYFLDSRNCLFYSHINTGYFIQITDPTDWKCIYLNGKTAVINHEGWSSPPEKLWKEVDILTLNQTLFNLG